MRSEREKEDRASYSEHLHVMLIICKTKFNVIEMCETKENPCPVQSLKKALNVYFYCKFGHFSMRVQDAVNFLPCVLLVFLLTLFKLQFRFITLVYFCREGSVVAHSWIVLSIPSSHTVSVTLQKVTSSLEEGLRGYSRSKVEETASFDGYLLHVPTLFVSGEMEKQKQRFKKKFFHYI